MGAVAKTYSLDMSVVNGIKELADQMRIKQGALIQLMFERFRDGYTDDDDDLDAEEIARLDREVEKLERGELKTVTQEEMEAWVNARLKAAA
ncbi:MAG: hypothetical protein LBC09_01805 [Helicobacteraceae bacterium]|jgi:phosphate uptake regulator|nr:hypothetical protein [Helicobacteraceae bacterium]